MIYRLERIPKPGETLEHAGLVFEVAAADKKRINKLLVRVLEVKPR
ncbi:MAG: Transporter associated domain protein [Deltaproteobacteria bacterium ADurb.Bin510]|nr:MAG: Transporter associated domain protein [Deltaproteobacteria bacterium ADurb.Bin510]